MDSWLKADPQNVAAVHCLAGKGRTGTVIAAYLLYVGLISDPIEALAYFAKKRSYEREPPKYKSVAPNEQIPYILSLGGVNSPSQIRYVQYFHHVLTNNNSIPENKLLHLRKIFIHGLSPVMRKQVLDNQLVINIYEMVSTGPNTVVKRLLFTTNNFDRVGHLNPLDEIISFTCNLDLRGDILITCHNPNTLRDEKVFRFAFHTGFVPGENVLRLRKCDMDEACHNKTNYITNNFMIDLMFDSTPSASNEVTLETETKEQMEAEEEDSEIVSHKHLYAKTNPNTRNHILLEFAEDDPEQQVVKRQLTQSKPLAGVRSQSAPIVVAFAQTESTETEPVISTRAPSVPVVIPIATAELITEKPAKSKKPDILVQILLTQDDNRPIVVRFRVKKQK